MSQVQASSILMDSKAHSSGYQAREQDADDDLLALEFGSKASKFGATRDDVREMDLLGIEPTFKRRFKFMAMVGFASTVVLGWQVVLATFYFSLDNGGTGDMIVIYVPDSDAVNSQWFPTTIAIVMLILSALFNMRLAKVFPTLEGVMLVIHVASWAAFIVVLWVTSPRGRPSDVLFTFNNGGGWSSAGLSTFVGLIGSSGSLVGFDSAVHMTENVRDASRAIPLSLVVSYALNASMGLITGVTVIFCAGDMDAVLAVANQAPYVTIFLNSTGSKAGTLVMLIPILLMFMSSMLSGMATASRQVWAFARDDGLPWSDKLKRVPDAEVPQTALWVTVAATFIITCINFGSNIGFNAICSLVGLALNISYLITISCTIYHKVRGPGLPRARFSLGRWGLLINIISWFLVLPYIFFIAWPPYAQVTAGNMNYGVVMFVIVILIASGNYLAAGRKRFAPTLRKEE
ncbi:hypothetical protein LTR08_002239 [Meristemomyces frigidus]|nr:hypothetical protein LTR08_002239 [Meristemomyces frigidus]